MLAKFVFETANGFISRGFLAIYAKKFTTVKRLVSGVTKTNLKKINNRLVQNFVKSK
jgi:hypothetical protein